MTSCRSGGNLELRILNAAGFPGSVFASRACGLFKMSVRGVCKSELVNSGMYKLILFPLLLIAGCVFAGAYGALHDQVSYTVSPDYYFAFKFHQFEIPPELQGRVGAAIVGWMASWWMGVLISLPILLVGLMMPDAKTYLTRCLVAFGVVTLTALVVGLAALAIAAATIHEHTLPDYWYPEGVQDKVAFARAGTMHNFSYLGGFLGILTGCAYLVFERYRLKRRGRSSK